MNQTDNFQYLLFMGMSLGSILLKLLVFVAALYLVRYVMGIQRLLAIAEETLALNRQRAAHAEKTAAMLVAIRDRMDKDAD